MQAIGAVQIGEHVPEIGKHLASWLTECLQKPMSAADFTSIWTRYCDHEDDTEDDDDEDDAENDEGIPRYTQTEDGEHYYWRDGIDNIDSIAALYTRAVQQRASHFLAVDDNAFVSLVACAGDPGLVAICRCLEDSDDVAVIMTADPDHEWPENLGKDAPIAHVWFGFDPSAEIELRDGTIVTVD